jgi:hypothetical protein
MTTDPFVDRTDQGSSRRIAVSSQPSKYEGKDLVKVLVERTLTDDAFRREFLGNPEAVIERETGKKLPEGIHIKAIEDTPTTAHIVIPAKTAAGGELSDAELKKVAGGVQWTGAVIKSGPSPFSIISGPGLRADWGIGGVGSMPPGGAQSNPA